MDANEVEIETLNQGIVALSHFRGKVLLIVNTAVRCGFHYQEKKLIRLAHRYSDTPFAILNFPSNSFSNQEPRSNQVIQCDVISYPSNIYTFAKVDVKGENQAPIYQYLEKHFRKFSIFPVVPWNYTKFLVNREGKLIRRFLPWTPFKVIQRKIRKEIYR